MGAVYYKITINYPNGGVEELDQIFRDLKEAIDYGNGLLAQIPGNAPYKGKNAMSAYFVVIKVEGGRSAGIAYASNK